jgi:hypothetical protein
MPKIMLRVPWKDVAADEGGSIISGEHRKIARFWMLKSTTSSAFQRQRGT